MLLMTDVSKTYPSGSVALRDVNIHIQPGEFVFVVGPSGAGKSTFIKMLFREVIPTTGNIYVNGVDLLELKEKEIPYLRIQFFLTRFNFSSFLHDCIHHCQIAADNFLQQKHS